MYLCYVTCLVTRLILAAYIQLSSCMACAVAQIYCHKIKQVTLVYIWTQSCILTQQKCTSGKFCNANSYSQLEICSKDIENVLINTAVYVG